MTWKLCRSGQKRQLPIVRIAYRDLTAPVPDNGPSGRYVYYWPFRSPPVAGQRVIVPTYMDPENYAVVTGPGNAEDADGAPIKTVANLVPDEVIAEAHRKADADLLAWLAVAQRLAGFPPSSDAAPPPDEYPFTAIPPADTATDDRETAKEYGFVWRRVHRRAKERGLDEEQVKQFERISERWFDIAFGRPVRDLQATPSDTPLSSHRKGQGVQGEADGEEYQDKDRSR